MVEEEQEEEEEEEEEENHAENNFRKKAEQSNLPYITSVEITHTKFTYSYHYQTFCPNNDNVWYLTLVYWYDINNWYDDINW